MEKIKNLYIFNKLMDALKDPLLKRAIREDKEKYKEEYNAPLEEALEECIPSNLAEEAKKKTGKSKLQDIENLTYLFVDEGKKEIMKRFNTIIEQGAL